VNRRSAPWASWAFASSAWARSRFQVSAGRQLSPKSNLKKEENIAVDVHANNYYRDTGLNEFCVFFCNPLQMKTKKPQESNKNINSPHEDGRFSHPWLGTTALKYTIIRIAIRCRSMPVSFELESFSLLAVSKKLNHPHLLSIATPLAWSISKVTFETPKDRKTLQVTLVYCCKSVVPHRWVATTKWVAEEGLWGRE